MSHSRARVLNPLHARPPHLWTLTQSDPQPSQNSSSETSQPTLEAMSALGRLQGPVDQPLPVPRGSWSHPPQEDRQFSLSEEFRALMLCARSLQVSWRMNFEAETSLLSFGRLASLHHLASASLTEISFLFHLCCALRNATNICACPKLTCFIKKDRVNCK